MKRWLVAALAAALSAAGVLAAPTNSLDAVVELWRSGKADAAMEAANAAIQKEPGNARLLGLRAQMRVMTGKRAEAETDLSAAIAAEPDSAWLRQERAQLRFRLGRIEDSVADFDKAVEMAPRLLPQNWQRGIALYYAGRFTDGRKQFEVHQSVNPEDVENAAWHFLCTAREKGVTNARNMLITVQRDGRVPMKEIQQLFAGKATALDVLNAAAKAEDDRSRRDQQFYAHLYLGLFFEATGVLKDRDDHIREAAKLADPDNYMGAVALVHAQRLKLISTPNKP
jgi:lipoprotein NlpI